MILKIYSLRAPQENISLFLIPGDTSSGKVFRRSSMNPRRQDSVINSYAGGILSKGVMLLFRGCIIAVQSDTEGVYDLIAGASLVEAIYLAIEMKPGNQYVKELVETGIRIQVLLRGDSPQDVHRRAHPHSTKTGSSTIFVLLGKVRQEGHRA